MFVSFVGVGGGGGGRGGGGEVVEGAAVDLAVSRSPSPTRSIQLPCVRATRFHKLGQVGLFLTISLAYGGCARGTNGGQNCTVLTSSNFIVD